MTSFAEEIDPEMRNSYMGQMGLSLLFGAAALGAVEVAPQAPELAMNPVDIPDIKGPGGI